MRPSVRHNGIRIVLAGLLALSIWLVAPSAIMSESAKVQGLLRLIQKAGSLDEVGLAFERAKLSQQEVKELEAAIGRPPYADKLRSLSGPAVKRASTTPEVTARRVVVDTAKKRTIDGRAATLANRARAKTPTAVQSLKPRSVSRPATAAAKPALPSGGVTGRITGLNADPIRVGDRLLIAGSGFGSRRGSVELVTPENRYICELGSWNDTRIEATVPGYMDHVIGDRDREFRLRIMLGGNALGPTRDIRLHPSIRDMEIVSLSSDEIMPGNDVAIEGRWFYGRGSVEFDFGSQLFRGTVQGWTDSLITAGIPDGIGGLPRTRGQLIIRNDRGREVRHPITFEPDKEQVTLTMSHEIDRSRSATELTRTFDYFQNFEMKEGWLVKRYSKEVVSGRGSARYMLEPTPGTTRIHNIINLSARSFTRLRVASHVTIEGPKGTAYW